MKRYIGNKARLVEWVAAVAGELVPRPAVVADPMCGTATVSAAFRAAGHRVVAGDLLRVAVQSAQVRLLLDAPPSFGGASYDRMLEELNALPGVTGYFFRELSAGGAPVDGEPPRAYFLAGNAARIDAIRVRIRELEQNGDIELLEAALLKHDLVRAANRVANIAGTYGHYRGRVSPSAAKPLHLTPTAFDAGLTGGHEIRRAPAAELVARDDLTLAYVDPPYTWRQYGANYHVPETIARGDEPQPVGRSGLRPWRDTHSDFCLPRRVESAFRQLFAASRADWVLVSYSEDGLVSIERLSRILSEFGRVRIESTTINRFRSNAGGVGGRVTEYLLVADCRRAALRRAA